MAGPFRISDSSEGPQIAGMTPLGYHVVPQVISISHDYSRGEVLLEHSPMCGVGKFIQELRVRRDCTDALKTLD